MAKKRYEDPKLLDIREQIATAFATNAVKKLADIHRPMVEELVEMADGADVWTGIMLFATGIATVIDNGTEKLGPEMTLIEVWSLVSEVLKEPHVRSAAAGWIEAHPRGDDDE